MTGKVHTILGVSTAIATAVCLPEVYILGATVYPAIGIIAAIPGSLLPDIDIKQSKAGQKVPWLSKMLTHRGITHTLLVPAIIAGIFFLCVNFPVVPSLLFGLEIGYLAHIVADMFNSKGVPVLWPIMPSKIHFASIKTSSAGQQTVFIIIWEVLLALWILSHYELFPIIMGLFK